VLVRIGGAGSVPPEEVMGMLNVLFAKFDELTQTWGTYKVETVGGAWEDRLHSFWVRKRGTAMNANLKMVSWYGPQMRMW
jgi:hypothetical protein